MDSTTTEKRWGRSIAPHGHGQLTERTRRNLATLARWHAVGCVSYGSGDTGRVHGPELQS